MRTFLYAVWTFGALVDLAAVCRMGRNGLVRRYWLLAAYLLTCAVRTLVLMPLFRHTTAYIDGWTSSLPIAMLLEAAAAVSVFLVLVENYRKFRFIALTGMSILTVVAMLAVWSTRSIGAPLANIYQAMLLSQRYGSLVLVGLLAGSLALVPRSKYIPFRESARRAMTILTIDVIGSAMISSVFATFTPRVLWLWMVVYLVPMTFRIAMGGLWLFWMTPASDADPKIVQLSDGELEQMRIQSAQGSRLLLAEVRDAQERLGDLS